MTPEERQMLANLFERINATNATPRDAEAETFIRDAVRVTPFAPYVLAQTVLVQQHALEAAANRISALEVAAQPGAQPQEQSSFLGNLGKSLFGGGAPSQPPRPSFDPSANPRGPAPGPGQPYSAPPPPPQGYTGPPPSGPWGAPPAAGGGFLQNAASTAAGVAGGVALGNLLGGLFSGRSGGGLFGGGLGGAGFSGGGFPGGNETINNFYEVAPDGRDGSGQSAQDVNFDGLDDASFTDDSSSDGGGFDDV
jgi:hypothetical protein